MKIKKIWIFLITLVSISIFLLAYTPHYNYRYPSHIDEWHHITEAIQLQKGEYSGGAIGYRIGFHLILLLLAKITDLIPIYRFLPAIWAVISGLALFYVVYKKTCGRFDIALLAMVFFASIKSNVNITGLWFFTPLTFSIPFIFLYIYFFTEGVEKNNKKYILISLAIMAMLLPIHAISVLFAVPFLTIYSLCNLGFIKKEWRFCSAFLILPAIGLSFYKYTTKVPWLTLIGNLFDSLRFKYGWGVLELNNSPFELYSPIGYILAVLGLILVFTNKKHIKKYLAYGLWPITVLMSIVIFKITGTSYLCPYQRNLYYFAISLPILSAFGMENILNGKKIISKIGILFVIIIFAFKGYFYIPEKIAPYRVIDKNEYNALLFLANIPEKAKVMAIPRISTALYPVSGHKPLTTYFFYGKGNREEIENFFSPRSSPEIRRDILEKYRAKYILSKSRIDNDWKLIYENGCYIYKVD